MLKIKNSKIMISIIFLLPFLTYAGDSENLNSFNGYWYNKDANTNGIVKFKIFKDAKDKYLLELKGKCHPTLCNIGPYNLNFYSSDIKSNKAVAAVATYNVKWSKGYIILKLNHNNEIELSKFTDFSDNRKNTMFLSSFHKKTEA